MHQGLIISLDMEAFCPMKISIHHSAVLQHIHIENQKSSSLNALQVDVLPQFKLHFLHFFIQKTSRQINIILNAKGEH